MNFLQTDHVLFLKIRQLQTDNAHSLGGAFLVWASRGTGFIEHFSIFLNNDRCTCYVMARDLIK